MKAKVTSCLIVLSLVTVARAVELWSDTQAGQSADLDVAAKWTSLTSRAPDDPVLYPHRINWTELLRLRLGLTVRYSQRLETRMAYEQSLRWRSHAGAGEADQLPATDDVWFRLVQLNWSMVRSTDTLQVTQEIDRLLAAYHPAWGDVTVGRQAVGLGRGVIFSAIDLFAPFSPLDIDREWRRGVDALRVEHPVSTTGSVELLGVFAETWEQSALLGRARGYAGNLDMDIIAGKRAADTLLGASLSAPVGGAEVHGELAYFHTPEPQPAGEVFGSRRAAVTGVIGASYTFDWGNGLTVLSEYLYNGLGVRDIGRDYAELINPTFVTRVQRGDMRILGRQAWALQLSYIVDLNLSSAVLILNSPTDGSGILLPSLVLDVGQSGRVTTGLTLPWGHGPRAGRPQSEYGGTPLSLFLQAAWYY